MTQLTNIVVTVECIHTALSVTIFTVQLVKETTMNGQQMMLDDIINHFYMVGWLVKI